MMRTVFTRIEVDAYGVPSFHCETIGGAFLGFGVWSLLAAKHARWWPWEAMGWSNLMRARPHKGPKLFEPLTEHSNRRRVQCAIEAYAEARRKNGEIVDVDEIARVIGKAHQLREGGEN